MESIRATFLSNLKVFEEILGAKVQTIAAHGDFANRIVSVTNAEIINAAVRVEGGIRMEAYDEVMNGRLTFRASDAMFPETWRRSSPVEALEAGSPRVLVLVHPRQWERAPLSRARLDVQRLIEGLSFRIGG